MILRTSSGDVHVRSGEFQSMNDLLPRRANSGGVVPVTGTTVAGIPAWNLAVRIASQSVACLRLRVWRGEDYERRRVRTTWQASFFAGRPNAEKSWFQVWEETEASLTARNNAYWFKAKDPKDGQVVEVYSVPPLNVGVRWNREKERVEYRLRKGAKWGDWLDSSYVVHFRVGYPEPGCLVAPSPIMLHQETLAADLAKRRHENRIYEKGIMRGLAVTMPAEMDAEAAKRWQEVFSAEHGGMENSGDVRVFGGGATVTAAGLTLEEAQYIESLQHGAEEIARMTGVQASLLGVSKTDKPISPEHESDRWLRHGLGPRLERIEQTLLADSDFFGPGARDYPMFDTHGVVRGDLKTEAEIEHMQIQDGSLLPDEARRKRGQGPLPPIPEDWKQTPGMVPQVTPVGGTPNPSAADADEDDEEN